MYNVWLPSLSDRFLTTFLYNTFTLGIALVWLVNGLVCKLWHLVPRHEAIVARILGDAQAVWLTRSIGVLEIGMAVWVLSRRWPRWCAAVQIGTVLTMNLLERVLAVDLLLWGRLNMVFAVLFAGVVYVHGYILSSSVKRL